MASSPLIPTLSNRPTLSLIFKENQLILTENQNFANPSLVIERDDFNVSWSLKNITNFDGQVYPHEVFAVIGVINLLAGPYLIVAIDVESQGKIVDKEIFCVKKVDFVPILKNAVNELTTQQQADEKEYTDMLKYLLDSGFFYFSYCYDLSNSLERQMQYYLQATVEGKKDQNDSSADSSSSPSNNNFSKKRSKASTSSSSTTSNVTFVSNYPLWKYGDRRFIWNFHLQQKFVYSLVTAGDAQKQQQQQHPDITPFGAHWFVQLIQGYVGVADDCSVSGRPFQFALLSRRSKKRAGTRYHRRGADAEGNVANYAETEQIIILQEQSSISELSDSDDEESSAAAPSKKHIITSFVQIRGSIPLLWKQDVNLAYEPPIEIDLISSSGPFGLHFEEQLKLYKKQTVINLVKEKGSEGKLADAFAKHIQSTPSVVKNADDIKYVFFDLHRHCGQKNFDKLSILIDQIKQDVDSHGYFMCDAAKNVVLTEQRGVFRTNCKDCLDRTNLVQGVLGRLSLIQQLRDLSLIRNDAEVEADENAPFLSLFRRMWTDNGDHVSITYAGTGALKRDVTLTGKRTLQGMWDDGANAVTRYYLNNLRDGYRQDGIDLFLGNYVANKHKPSPFAIESETWFAYIIAFFLGIFQIFGPRSVKFKTDLFLAAIITIFALIVGKLIKIGKKMVNKPRLVVSHSMPSVTSSFRVKKQN